MSFDVYRFVVLLIHELSSTHNFFFILYFFSPKMFLYFCFLKVALGVSQPNFERWMSSSLKLFISVYVQLIKDRNNFLPHSLLYFIFCGARKKTKSFYEIILYHSKILIWSLSHVISRWIIVACNKSTTTVTHDLSTSQTKSVFPNHLCVV